MNKFQEELRGMSIKANMKFIIISFLAAILVVGMAKTNHVDAYEVVKENYTQASNIVYGPVFEELHLIQETEQEEVEPAVIEEVYEEVEDEDVPLGELEVNRPLIIDKPEEHNKCFTAYTDIGKGMSGVTAEMLDACTEYYSRFQNFENAFLNKGWIFIEAQEASGIDALYIYAAAVWESGWGSSHLAKTKGNYFGIGAWATDMSRAKHMGDSLYDGIVNGAIWIAEHYYENEQTNMYLMNSVPGHSYAPGNTVYIPKISQFINNFYRNWRDI